MTDEHLDKVLSLLYNTKQHYIYIFEIREQIWPSFPNISLVETLLIVEKVVRDGYATEEVQAEAKKGQGDKVSNDWYGYFITFEGIQLHEAGGYKHLRTKEATERAFQEDKMQLERTVITSNLQTNRTTRFSNFLSPLFAGIAGLMAILTYYNQKSSDSIQQQLLKQLQQQSTQQDSLVNVRQMVIDSLQTAKAIYLPDSNQ